MPSANITLRMIRGVITVPRVTESGLSVRVKWVAPISSSRDSAKADLDPSQSCGDGGERARDVAWRRLWQGARAGRGALT